MAKRGKFALEKVKQLVEEYLNGNPDTLWFSARSRSLDTVIRVFGCDNAEAEKIVLKGLLSLKK